MIVLNPDTTSHSIKVVPRTYALNSQVITLINEDTYQEQTVTLDAISLCNGYLTANFTLTVNEGDRYSIKIVNANDIIDYRGLIFVTSQATQNYSVHGTE